MPALTQITTNNSAADPIAVQIVDNFVIIEPLDGPTSVDDLMDRFPEEVYHQGRDTHLYRLLTALTGDAGLGILKRQTYLARLRFEAEFLNFTTLDTFYAAQFRFHRLRSETSDLSPDDALTIEQWNDIQLADQHYRNRIQEFFQAIQLGGTPDGLAMVAKSGSGLDLDVIEHYKYVFDQYSDLPLGIEPAGTTISTSEIVILPRFLTETDDESNEGYTQDFTWEYDFHPPLFHSDFHPAPVPTGADAFTVTKTLVNEGTVKILPEIERNMIDLLDRLQPVGTLVTVQPDLVRHTSVDVQSTFASSERVYVTRLVTGNPAVIWPDVDPSTGAFIVANSEQEATAFWESMRELPVIFHTPEKILSYTEQALSDATYGTLDFYLTEQPLFESYHVGLFLPTLIGIFTFLSLQTADADYRPNEAQATQNTPLFLEGT